MKNFCSFNPVIEIIIKRLFFTGLIIICLAESNVLARAIEMRIEISSKTAAQIAVTGKLVKSSDETSYERKNWTFLDSYADAKNLSERITDLEFFDEKGRKVSSKKLGNGEYQTVGFAASWRFKVDLSVPQNVLTTAHVSWLTQNHGLLMMLDLMPQLTANAGDTVSAKVELVMPKDWRVASSENRTVANEFILTDAERGVFLVGNDLQERIGKLADSEFKVAMLGKWSFSVDDAVGMANTILEEHRRTFGEMATNRVQLLLLPFPQNVATERWRAETRGNTVTLLSNSSPFKSRALSQLHEQLRHEIYHLWIPNALALNGDYDWFYEGFTIYQALRTGIKLKYIRFDDYLDTMSRSFDLVRYETQNASLSLIDASKTRWQGNAGLVYAKGMTVAFLCDLAMLRESNGKRSLSDVFRELYKRHKKPNNIQDGNRAILAILNERNELRPLVTKFIENANVIEWSDEIKISGFQDVSPRTYKTKLAIIEKPNGKQRNLLAKLGYQREYDANVIKK
ncbi:MAG: hypothetical protein H7Z37_07505 [Pyrinomonadaceae bacterium]|nr:hypothetical protein [Pyrinomonadaceae bacterium]